jgi:hypothetical protein
VHDAVKIAQLVVPFLGRIVAFLVRLPRFNPPELRVRTSCQPISQLRSGKNRIAAAYR